MQLQAQLLLHLIFAGSLGTVEKSQQPDLNWEAFLTLLLKQLFGLLKLLNSDADPAPLAAGLALGLVLGFSPFLSLQTFLVLILCFFLRIQLGGALLSAFFFKFVAYLLDPVSDLLGREILEAQGLRQVFVTLYNMPIIPLTRFNNSIVMGSGAVGFLLAIPAYFLFSKLILRYRATVVAKLKGTKWWKALQATALFKWYATYDKLAN